MSKQKLIYEIALNPLKHRYDAKVNGVYFLDIVE